MVGVLIRFFVALPVLFALIIGLIHTRQPDHSPLRALFADAACDMPCFLGIELGETSLTDARTILSAHPWITQVEDRLLIDYMGAERLGFRWYWGENRREGESWSGELVSSYGTVYMVRLETGLTLGDLWFALGKPGMLTFNVVQSRQRPVVLLYNSFFADRSVAVASALDCPLSYRHFLQGEVYTLELRRRNSISSAEMAKNPTLLLRSLGESKPLC